MKKGISLSARTKRCSSTAADVAVTVSLSSQLTERFLLLLLNHVVVVVLVVVVECAVVAVNLHQTVKVDDELEIKAYYAGHVRAE